MLNVQEEPPRTSVTENPRRAVRLATVAELLFARWRRMVPPCPRCGRLRTVIERDRIRCMRLGCGWSRTRWSLESDVLADSDAVARLLRHRREVVA